MDNLGSFGHHEMHTVFPAQFGKAVLASNTGSMKQCQGLQLGHRATAIEKYNYLNAGYCLVVSNKFVEIVVFNDGGECHDGCGILNQHCQKSFSTANVGIVDFDGHVEDYDLFVESANILNIF